MKHLKLLILVPLAFFLAGRSNDGQGESKKETRKATAARDVYWPLNGRMPGGAAA